MKRDDQDELRREYRREELGKGIRGKYHDECAAGTNLILLSPDVAEVFSDEESVNDALRELIRVARRSTDPKKRQQA